MTEQEYRRLSEQVRVDAAFIGIRNAAAMEAFISENDDLSAVNKLRRKIQCVLDDYNAIETTLRNSLNFNQQQQSDFDAALEEDPFEHSMVAKAALSKAVLAHHADREDWSAYDTKSYTHVHLPKQIRSLVFRGEDAELPEWYRVLALSRVSWPKSIRIAIAQCRHFPYFRLILSLLRRENGRWDAYGADLLYYVTKRIGECESYLHQLWVLAQRIESSEESISHYDPAEQTRRKEVAKTLELRLGNLVLPMRKNMLTADLASELSLMVSEKEVYSILDKYMEINFFERGQKKALYEELKSAGLYNSTDTNFYNHLNK